MVQFRRLTGAAGDVHELEYVAALHQTCLPETRANGTVSSRDVQRLLVSRYNLRGAVSHAQCLKVVRSLGGGAAQPELRSSSSRGSKRLAKLVGKLQRSNHGHTSTTTNTNITAVPGSTNDIVREEVEEDDGSSTGTANAVLGNNEEQAHEEDEEQQQDAAPLVVDGESPTKEAGEDEKDDDKDTTEEKSGGGGSFLGDLGAALLGKNIVEAEKGGKTSSATTEQSPKEEDNLGNAEASVTDGTKDGATVELNTTTKEEVSEITAATVTGVARAVAAIEQKEAQYCHANAAAVEEEPPTQEADAAAAAAASEPSNRDASVEIANGSAENVFDARPESHLDDKEIPEEYLDLVQVLAILLIPTLARAGQKLQANQEVAAVEIVRNETEEEEGSKNSSDETSQQQQQRQQESSLEPQPAHLIEDGLRFLLKNVYIDADDTLSIDLVEALLLEFGEYERAQDRQLLEEMVQAATTPSGRLDAASFAQALTADLRAWEIGSEDRMSTYAEDVFGGDPVAAAKAKDPSSRAFEMSAIDYVVDQHTSLLIVGITWTFYFMVRRLGFFLCGMFVVGQRNKLLLTRPFDFFCCYFQMSLTYGTLVQSLVKIPCDERGQGDEFGCQLKGVLWTWLVFAIFLSLFGCVVIVPLSLGNSPTNRTPARMLASCLLSCVYTMYE